MEKFVKNFATFILLAICAMFVIRCFMVADKSVFSKPAVTELLKNAYADGESVTYMVEIQKEISEDGYFSAYAFYYTPESGEVQLTVRWNDSVYEYTDMEAGHEFSFYLLNETTGAKYPLTAVDAKDRNIYNFRRLTAEGVSLGETEQMVVVMELRDGFESVHPIKYAEQQMDEYRLPASVRKEME
ncbi:MAG: hypothetical protein IKI93_08715 [Clostridia bacterium]|nr:hypothetical protein [Clostridia bacterium]